MSSTNISEQIEHGDVILRRLAKRTLTAGLKPYVATFKSEYDGFNGASTVAQEARKKRDQALGLVGKADDTLDVDVESLATKMAGDKMGPRANPFRDFSRYSPSALIRLPYAVEADEVLKLVEAVLNAGPGEEVVKAANKCRKGADAVKAALDDLTHPQAEYSTALAARDALLPDCVKALRKLKTQARAAWDGQPGVYEAVFAPPDKVQAPKKTRAATAGKKTKVKPIPAPEAKKGGGGDTSPR